LPPAEQARARPAPLDGSCCTSENASGILHVDTGRRFTGTAQKTRLSAAQQSANNAADYGDVVLLLDDPEVKVGRSAPVVDMAKDPMAVEQWIKGLQTIPRKKGEKPRELAPKSKLHTRAVMHRLFEYAMRWRYLDCQRNPMSLIELKGTSRRVRVIYLLTPQQYYVILSHLAPHIRVMAVLAMNTALRISEILGLRWRDIDFEQATLMIQRSVVGKYEDETKTLASASVLPLHELLVQELRAWQARGQNVNGWLFGNIDTGRPYHRVSLQKDHLIPAGKKAGIPNLGWHNFRHTYRARLGDSGAAPEVQQKLMRHSSIDMTMRYGQNHMLNSTRSANAKLVEELLAAGALAADAPLLRPQIS